MDLKTCRHPDRDCPGLTCGYPLPCPWHTVVIDCTRDPAILEIPVTADQARRPSVRMKLSDIAEVLIQDEEEM